MIEPHGSTVFLFNVNVNYSYAYLDITCSFFLWSNLLALSVGQSLCVNFYVSRANFLTTLRSHLDITHSCYFWSCLFNVDDESLHTLDT
jgi:hypothetical protein